jgi:hypothetical protein
MRRHARRTAQSYEWRSVVNMLIDAVAPEGPSALTLAHPGGVH